MALESLRRDVGVRTASVGGAGMPVAADRESAADVRGVVIRAVYRGGAGDCLADVSVFEIEQLA